MTFYTKIEHTTGDTWRNVRNELERMHLVTLRKHGVGALEVLTALFAGRP